MTEIEINSKGNWTGTILLTLIFGIFGYFVYNGLDGALSIILLGFLYALSILIGLIPFIGFVLQAVIMQHIWSFTSELTGIGPTILTTWMYWLYLAFGIIATIVTTFVLVMVLNDR